MPSLTAITQTNTGSYTQNIDDSNLLDRSASGEKYSFFKGELMTHQFTDKIKKVYNWFCNSLYGKDEADRRPKKIPLEAMQNSNEKRSIQQTPPTIYQKSYFLNSPEAKWDKIRLLVSGNYGILAGATVPDATAAHQNEQRIILFKINNNAIQILDSLSDAISAQMPPREGENNIEIAGGERHFHIITESSKGIFHTVIANETLVVPQYLAASYASLNITSKGYAPRPIKLLGNGCAFAPAYGSTYYFSYTNASGKFNSPGWNMDTFTTQKPFPVETLSFTSGTSSVLENIGNNRRLYVPSFGQSFSPIGTNIIDFNNQTIDQGLINQFYGAKTPILYGRPITLIAPANNYTTAAIVTALLNQRQITSSRILAPNSGIGIRGEMKMANCAAFSDINAYVRDAVDAVSNYAIKFDIVNATLNSSSITGGEKTYNNFNLTDPPMPQVGCFDNGKVMIAFLENGRPAFYTDDFLNSNGPAPSANPSPSPSPDLFISITIPINLGEMSIPVTPDIIKIGSAAETIKVVNLNQYQLFYPNQTMVTDGAILTRDDLYNLTISQGNATKGTYPLLEACDKQGSCQLSTAEGYKIVFSGEGHNALLIGLATAAVFLITAVATFFVYRNRKCMSKIAPFRDRPRAAVSSDEEEYHQHPK